MKEVMKTTVYIWKNPKSNIQGEYECAVECIGPIDIEEVYNWARSNNFTASIDPDYCSQIST